MLRAPVAVLHALVSYASIVASEGFERSRRGPRKVVQGVVLRGDTVLLTERRTLRGWELPGGNAEPGEPPRDALRREVLEETGFEVRVGELVGRYRRTGFLAHEAQVYRCEIEGGHLRSSWETPRVALFPCERLPGSLFPWFRSPLNDARRGARDLDEVEHLGWASVWAGMKIDLRTRMRGADQSDAVQIR